MEGREENNGYKKRFFDLEGKRITIFYDDGDHISRKDGLCTFNTDDDILLDNRILIQKRRIVRVEVSR